MNTSSIIRRADYDAFAEEFLTTMKQAPRSATLPAKRHKAPKPARRGWLRFLLVAVVAAASVACAPIVAGGTPTPAPQAPPTTAP